MARALRFKFQSFVDINTRADTMQILQWSVGGNEVIQRCRHLFGAYKYFKLGKISVKMVPASTLPVDPLQLSYADDDPQSVDPRDQMNPGLVRITNGEDVFTDVSKLTTEAMQVSVYNSMMLDPRWSKFMLQSGFRRSAYPLYWQVGQFAQDKYPGSTVNVPFDALIDGTAVLEAFRANLNEPASGYAGSRVYAGSSSRGLFQVGHRGKLGWLPTDFYQEVANSDSDTRYTEMYGLNNVPEVSVITCVLPKAYKTQYYYRVFITEEVLFSGLRSAPYIAGTSAQGTVGYALTGIDQFLVGTPTPVIPTALAPIVVPNPTNNGGGDLP